MAQHAREKTWLDVLDFDKLIGKNCTAETPIFVDIGGGKGHQCALLKHKYPGSLGRIILQDSEPVIERALQTAGVERVAADFFEAQPVQGKRSRGQYGRYAYAATLKMLIRNIRCQSVLYALHHARLP